jgi:LysM repeat protein
MTPLSYRLTTGILGLAACLFFNSCESTGNGGTSSNNPVDYTSPTSRMSRKEKENYAFDDSGKYRESWVAANSGGKVKDTSMSTDSPYVQDYNSSPATPSSTTDYTSTRVTSPAYADDTPASSPPKKSTASNSSGSRKSSSSSNSRKSTASKSSGSKKTVASNKSKKPASKPTAKPAVVTVKHSDTLYSLSKKTGVPVEKIKSYNGMKSNTLRDGSKIKIPPKKKS